MVPRVAGPSPRLGRVLGPLGRRAEALGSSDTAAARPPGANGNYRSGPSQKSQMRVGGTIENYDFFCRRPLPIDSTRLCWGRTDHRYPGRLPAVYSCTLGGSPSCTLGGSPACAALQTRPSDTPLVSGARAEPSGAERSRAERGTPSLNGLSAESNLEPRNICRAKGPPRAPCRSSSIECFTCLSTSCS